MANFAKNIRDHMKFKLFAILASVIYAGVVVSAHTPDYSGLTSKKHPRLFLTDDDIKVVRRQVANGSNPYLVSLHQQMMRTADTKGMSPDSLSFNPETATVTLLGTMRSGLVRIVSAAYAYRFTKDKSYLKHVEMDINTVCDKMAYWDSKHDLERAEIALAMAVAYDWLYNSLKPQTKDRIIEFIKVEIYDKFENARFYKMTNNWNHVNNCGITCAALATFENWPELAKTLIEKSVASNPLGMKAVYAPDGASPEGPGYWSYATSFEGVLLMALQDCLGTDFGLSESEGFDKANRYRAYTINGFGQYYNYSDCGRRASVSSGAWYCAWRFNDPSMLFWEVSMLEKDKYVGNRTLFLAIACALRMGKFTCKAPEEQVFMARGEVPVAVLRRGWEKNDAYLGIKGGTPRSSHAHMDHGSFVFDADGVRWIDEYPYTAYEKYRRILKKAGSETTLFNFSQDSWRWHVFAYSPFRHSTITVDDMLFDVDGHVELLSAKEENGRLSAVLDMTQMYFGRVTKMIRTAAITENDDLEIIDHIEVGDKDVNLRWSFVSTARPAAGPEGIALKKNDKSMLLRTNAPDAEYVVWPSDPTAYDTPISKYEVPQKGFHVAGYLFSLKAGDKIDIVTTLKRK